MGGYDRVPMPDGTPPAGDKTTGGRDRPSGPEGFRAPGLSLPQTPAPGRGDQGAAVRRRRRQVLERVASAESGRDADALLPEIESAFDDAPEKGAVARWALSEPPARRRRFLQKELPDEMADDRPGTPTGPSPDPGAFATGSGPSRTASSVPPWPERQPSGEELAPPRHAPVPRYKAAYLKAKGQERNWKEFQDAVDALPGITDAQKTALREIYAAEGFSVNDDGSSASSGILRKSLQAAKASGQVSGLDEVENPSDLTQAQRAKVMRWFVGNQFRKIGRHTVLDQVGDTDAAAALADTLYRHGGPEGSALIQRAINRVAPGSVEVDSSFGSRTLAAYRSLSSDAKTRRQLLDALRDLRNTETYNHERARMDHFAFSNRR